jgi:hypothetical protein
VSGRSFANDELAGKLGLKPVCRALGIPMFDATGKRYEDKPDPARSTGA